jgi:hypothetical protein
MNSYAMTEYEVYKMYLALKLHFTTEAYDVIKQKGKVRASKQAFAKRKDLYSIKKIAKNYSDEEIANFLVANFTSGDRWGGVFDTEAGDRFLEWKRKIEALSYNFEKDLEKISFEMENMGKTFGDAFLIEKNQHPYIIKSFLRRDINLETLVVLEKIDPYLDKFDNNIDDTIIWPDISRLIRKYKPFLNFDKEKYAGIYRRKT